MLNMLGRFLITIVMAILFLLATMLPDLIFKVFV